MTETIDAAGIYYRQLNETIRQKVAAGSRHLKLVNVRGQRYIGAGLIIPDLQVEIEGVPGDDLAFCLGGPTITVRGPGQNAIANTMDSGVVAVHGPAGDALAYAMRGGKLFVRDSVGYRVGIHMKEYRDSKPAVVIGGLSGDFLGEYMAGGTIIVLNRENTLENVVGLADQTLATGIHGGEIYIFNYDLPAYMPGIGAQVAAATAKDLKRIQPLIEEYAERFNLPASSLHGRDAVKILPAGSRPFSGFYFPAYPVQTGLTPEQKEMASPCETACPVGIPTGRFLGHIRHGEYAEALDLIDNFTPFRYSNCGFICSYRCMDACSRGKVDFPVRSAELARNLHSEHGIKKEEARAAKIAVVGAGPAGLSSAYFLARHGYSVDVYEAADLPGGKMHQVISRQRLPMEDLEKDLANIKALGIKFHFGQKVDRDLLERLLGEFDHVIVAVGAHQPLHPPVKGSDLIRGGLDFLKAFNLGDEIKIGPRAVLIGCGDAALDGIEALIELGLEPQQITVIDIQTPSARPEELRKWTSTGVRVLYPRFLQEVTEEGVFVHDSTGSRSFIPGDAIAFINEKPQLDFLPPELTENINKRGFFETADGSGATPHSSLSITGDVAGLGLVADSIRKGRECAERIHCQLQGLPYEKEERETIRIEDLPLRANTPCSDPGETMIMEEYTRCLHCGVCVRCDECIEACPRGARSREDDIFTVNMDKCGGCGSCSAACRGGVVRMVPRK